MLGRTNAIAPSVSVKFASGTGSGTTLTVSGLGFKPDVILLRTAIVVVTHFRQEALGAIAARTLNFKNTGESVGNITSTINNNGFTASITNWEGTPDWLWYAYRIMP